MKKLHIICGMCGSDEYLSYQISDTALCNNDGIEFPGVYIRCENCSTLTTLDEHIKQYIQ